MISRWRKGKKERKGKRERKYKVWKSGSRNILFTGERKKN
jgi:hypothetical protein